MNAVLTCASRDYMNVINNLMQFYIYDFSEYIAMDVEADGLFKAYPYIEDYWKEDGRFPYLIRKAEKYVGFVLVKTNRLEKPFFSIAEFFILKKYRGEGIGKAIAMQVFDLHKGDWEVHQRENNKPAREFWKKVIDRYTNGQFTERFEQERWFQSFRNG